MPRLLPMTFFLITRVSWKSTVPTASTCSMLIWWTIHPNRCSRWDLQWVGDGLSIADDGIMYISEGVSHQLSAWQMTAVEDDVVTAKLLGLPYVSCLWLAIDFRCGSRRCNLLCQFTILLPPISCWRRIWCDHLCWKLPAWRCHSHWLYATYCCYWASRSYPRTHDGAHHQVLVVVASCHDEFCGRKLSPLSLDVIVEAMSVLSSLRNFLTFKFHLPRFCSGSRLRL